MSQLLIQAYLNEIDRLKTFSGSSTEGVISEAFKDLLKAWTRQEKLIFLSQYEFLSPQKNRIRPDGTILHGLRVPHGYWEAKDTDDDLDEEIRRKLAKGYPQDNIIFENSTTAVLYQNRVEVMRSPMTDVERLGRLVSLFFAWERPEIADFRRAVRQFRTDLPAVLGALRERIDEAYAENADFRGAADAFLAQARQTINPIVSEADIREMLIQHILTEEIFAHVFDQRDFHRENNIAKSLYALEGQFFTGSTKKETLKGLQPYYAAIRSAAALVSSHHEKQSFLKVIYENFYKVYNPKAADRLGVVYTPTEIVRFMIEGADWLTQKHFGRTLVDRDVEILDPATGTGTFICELLEHFRGQPQKLAYKYKNELHANEVAILPYYVANLNIEATYAAITGQFAEFPNLCFVDTLDNTAALGIRAGHQGELFGAISEENVERIRRQNGRKISVVLGNPPYNAWQETFNSRNPNRAYRRIDQTIHDTYVRRGTAQNKNSVYDMYTRFFRWASDRVHDDGVIAFITNRNFIAKAAFDGFRKTIAEEFHEIYVIDLGGDVRANPKLSGTKHNVFGIQTGVAISFLVKQRGKAGSRIFYARRPEFDTGEEKLAFLGQNKAALLPFDRIEPDAKANWVEKGDDDWERLAPLCSSASPDKRRTPKTIFQLMSNGIKSQKDDWVYDINAECLATKISYLVSAYERQRRGGDGADPQSIKWDADLERRSRGNVAMQFDPASIVQASYRPFAKRAFYFDAGLNARLYRLPAIFPPNGSNVAISYSARGFRSGYCVCASDAPIDLHFGAAVDAYQCVSRYRYTPAGERVDNITDWALRAFRAHYASPAPLAGEGGVGEIADRVADTGSGEEGPLSGSPPQGGRGKNTPANPLVRRSPAQSASARAIGRDNIFHYVYAVLHDPIYRETFALNLKRDFPRIPLYPDFWRWAAWGDRLMALHIGYESVEPFPLVRHDIADGAARAAGVAPKPVLKANRDAGTIQLDSETQLSGVPPMAWEYTLGNRTALDWVLDQHKEKTPRDPTIRERFNTYRFADYKEKAVDLLRRVTAVSVETVAIVAAMRRLPR